MNKYPKFSEYFFMFQIIMAGNPWQVDSILAFYRLMCPECNFNTKQENNFIHHAKEYHPSSFVLFEQESFNSGSFNLNEHFGTSSMKQEHISNLNYKDYYASDGRPTTDNLPLSLSYPVISMTENDR